MLIYTARFIFSANFGRARFWCAFLIYFLMVLFGAIPGVRAEAGEIASGLVLHSLAYATLTFLFFTGSRTQSFYKALQIFVLVALLGALDELIQSFFPYRRAAVQDWIVDISAAAVMLVLLYIFWPSLQRAVSQRIQG